MLKNHTVYIIHSSIITIYKNKKNKQTNKQEIAN